MVHESGRHGKIVVPHDGAALAQLVDVDQWKERCSILVGDPDFDVIGIVDLDDERPRVRVKPPAPDTARECTLMSLDYAEADAATDTRRRLRTTASPSYAPYYKLT